MSDVFGERIEVPGESIGHRLTAALDFINDTASTWFDGTVDSIDKRMNLVSQTMTLSRQAHSDGRDVTVSSLSAMDIENSLDRLYSALSEVHDLVAYQEMDLPRYSINSA